MSDVKDHPNKCNSSALVKLRILIREGTILVQKLIDIGTFFFSIAMKILGPCLISVAHGLLGFVSYTWLFHVIPLWLDDDWTLGISGIASATVVGAFILFNILYNYWHAICLNAGTPGSYEEAVEKAALTATPENGNKQKQQPEKVRQCQKCLLHKPERAHHCSICRRCVLKMDHHCPWINNCVGFMNYRYFCLFKLFTAVGCVYLMAMFAWNFEDIVLYNRRRRGTRDARQDIMTCFTVCGSVLLALGGLGGFHAFLVITNQTTIEFQTNLLKRRQARKNGEYFRNTYDLGRSRNFQQVFGPNNFWGFKWLFPYINVAPSGDGITYPSLRARVV